MKILLGFFIGTTVGLLLALIISQNTTTISAESSSDTSYNGIEVGELIPDLGIIYREALIGPYRQVESEITDPDIARYFRTYLERTGLDYRGDSQ